MPNLAYLTCGNIKTDTKMKGREGQIEVRGYHHHAQRPINAVTGEVGTRRSHSLFTIRKDIDYKTSGLLRFAHKNGAVLSPWTLDLYHMPAQGDEVKYFTISLTNARIAEYRMVLPALTEAKNALIHEYEEISFIYDKISFQSHKHLTEIGSNPIAGRLFEADATGSVFDADWKEEQAKVAVKLVLKLLGDKADEFASDANLAMAIRNKVLGKALGNTAGPNSTGSSDGQGQHNVNEDLE
ncbi:MAG: type VI secretion system tube protein Hcp [Kofleriaceae bacterium]|nr:type VI secretion system tube protein Hcp [Kofleriaceae bacterium]